MVKEMTDHAAELQLGCDAMEEVSIATWKANAQLLQKATKNQNKINLMKESINGINRSNTTLMKRKERTVQRMMNECKESEKIGHSLVKELDSQSSEVSSVKDQLVRAQITKSFFLKSV